MKIWHLLVSYINIERTEQDKNYSRLRIPLFNSTVAGMVDNEIN